jgi:hypothetical protein
MTPAEAHVWIAVYAAEFAQRRKPFECIVAADVAVHDLRERGEKILGPLNAALRQGDER